MASEQKTEHIQLRVTPAQKRELVRSARLAGLDLSAFMLGRLLPPKRETFGRLVRALAGSGATRFELTEIGVLLSSLSASEFTTVLEDLPPVNLTALKLNQVAAMIETRAVRLGVRPPPWVGDTEPLAVPWFATELARLRLHLLTTSPPAFRRRNLFVDATFEDRA